MAFNANMMGAYTQAFATGYNTSMAIGNEITNASLARSFARMNAAAYRSQARLNLMAANQQNAYLNEELGWNVWNNAADNRIFRGKQIASWANSGVMDMSSGDYALTRDTAVRGDYAQYGMNRTAYLQSFQTEKDARMEATRLEYAARAQDAIRKSYSPLNAFISSQFAGLGAFANGASQYMQSYGFQGLSARGPVYDKGDKFNKTFGA